MEDLFGTDAKEKGRRGRPFHFLPFFAIHFRFVWGQKVGKLYVGSGAISLTRPAAVLLLLLLLPLLLLLVPSRPYLQHHPARNLMPSVLSTLSKNSQVLLSSFGLTPGTTKSGENGDDSRFLLRQTAFLLPPFHLLGGGDPPFPPFPFDGKVSLLFRSLLFPPFCQTPRSAYRQSQTADGDFAFLNSLMLFNFPCPSGGLTKCLFRQLYQFAAIGFHPRLSTLDPRATEAELYAEIAAESGAKRKRKRALSRRRSIAVQSLGGMGGGGGGGLDRPLPPPAHLFHRPSPPSYL